MKNVLFIATLFLILSSSKCKEDEVIPTGTLSLNFKTLYNNEPLIINKIYDYKGKKMRFTRFSFFVSDYQSYAGFTSVEQLDNIRLIDIANQTDSATASKGFNITLTNKLGNFTSPQLGLGVNKSKNAKKPKDYPSTNPLSDAGNYWEDWNSYIFSKLEGLMDKDGDGRFESGITLHTGGNETYQQLSFTKNFTIEEGKTTTLNFEIDMNKLLTDLDLTTINATHQTGDLPTMKKFMGNFQQALILK